MATTLMKSVASTSGAASARRKTVAPAGAHAIAMRSMMLPVRPSRQGAVTPQAFYLSPYACKPARVYRSSPFSLGMGRLASELLRESAACTHAVDISALEDRYVLTSDCPGMSEEDISVEISPERVLTIAGARKANPLHQQPRPAATPKPEPQAAAADGDDAASDDAPAAAPSSPEPAVRVSYRFSRSFGLPEDAEVDGVSALLDRGVLTVTVPRRVVDKPKPRRVSVSAAAGTAAPEPPSTV